MQWASSPQFLSGDNELTHQNSLPPSHQTFQGPWACVILASLRAGPSVSGRLASGVLLDILPPISHPLRRDTEGANYCPPWVPGHVFCIAASAQQTPEVGWSQVPPSMSQAVQGSKVEQCSSHKPKTHTDTLPSEELVTVLCTNRCVEAETMLRAPSCRVSNGNTTKLFSVGKNDDRRAVRTKAHGVLGTVESFTDSP